MQTAVRLIEAAAHSMQFLASLADLVVRLAVAHVFWKSGVTKLQSWESTLMLFEYEYAVPLISPGAAAYLGTAVELVLPVFLVLGLGGRLAALAIFIFNIIAVISYPDLSDSGRQFHVLWGILLAITLTHGPGRLSLDALIKRKWGTRHMQAERTS